MLTHPTLDKLQNCAFPVCITRSSSSSRWRTSRRSALRNARAPRRPRADGAGHPSADHALAAGQTRQTACIEDIDYRHPRGLDKAVMTRLATCQWVREHHNVLITGPTGIGKTWLGCALGHKACREGLTALYLRLPRFLQELAIAKGDAMGKC